MGQSKSTIYELTGHHSCKKASGTLQVPLYFHAVILILKLIYFSLEELQPIMTKNISLQ